MASRLTRCDRDSLALIVGCLRIDDQESLQKTCKKVKGFVVDCQIRRVKLLLPEEVVSYIKESGKRPQLVNIPRKIPDLNAIWGKYHKMPASFFMGFWRDDVPFLALRVQYISPGRFCKDENCCCSCCCTSHTIGLNLLFQWLKDERSLLALKQDFSERWIPLLEGRTVEKQFFPAEEMVEPKWWNCFSSQLAWKFRNCCYVSMREEDYTHTMKLV